MSEVPHPSQPTPLPQHASLEWLRKQAKRELASLRETNPSAQLADAQFRLAAQYGFKSWRALKAHIDAQTLDGQLFDAARHGRLDAMRALLDQHPDKLHARNQPYEWTLLHVAAQGGHLPIVELLLARGLDVNARERGDNTYAMHWAAAAGHLDVVRYLADAGGDVVGRGDDHELEVIGWATCWQPGPQREVAEFLVSRGARHHIFSAIAMDLAGEVRRIVDADRTALQRRMSRNEAHQMPLHFAVRCNRVEMVSLLLELGADPLAVDGDGFTAAAYATTPEADRRVMSSIAALTAAEMLSADRGKRRPHAGLMDVMAMLSLREWTAAETLVTEVPGLIAPGGAAVGALHLMAKRNDLAAVDWLLVHGAEPNARWAHWNAELTPLHLAVMMGHTAIVERLVRAGADPHIRDSAHDSSAIGWAEFFKRDDLVTLLRGQG
jgi:ankyrin repeat protein